MSSIKAFLKRNPETGLVKRFKEPFTSSDSYLYDDGVIRYEERLNKIVSTFAKSLAPQDAAAFLAAGFLGNEDFPIPMSKAPANRSERIEDYAHAVTSKKSRHAYPYIEILGAWPDKDAMLKAARDGVSKNSFENRLENVANWESLIDTIAAANTMPKQDVAVALSPIASEANNYEDFCYAAHDLGLERAMYFTSDEVNTMLYRYGNSISDDEKALALVQAKQNYIEDGNDDFYLLALTDNEYDISKFAKFPIKGEVFSAIEEMSPSMAAKLQNRARRENAQCATVTPAANYLVSQVSLLDDAGRPIAPKHAPTFDSALAEAHNVLAYARVYTPWVKAWYDAVSNPDELAKDPDRVDLVLDGFPKDLRVQLANVSQVLIAEAQKDPKKEALALEHLKELATDDYLNVYVDDNTFKTVVTGLGVFKDRVDILPDLECLVEPESDVRKDLQDIIAKVKANSNDLEDNNERER